MEWIPSGNNNIIFNPFSDFSNFIISLCRRGWKGLTGAMPDGWRTAQSSTLSLNPETSVDAKIPPLVFVTMATGTRKTSATTASASLPSSTVRGAGELEFGVWWGPRLIHFCIWSWSTLYSPSTVSVQTSNWICSFCCSWLSKIQDTS